MKTPKEQFIEQKIKKIHAEGVRGKQVPNKQAVAIAYSYLRRKKTA
jgi:hypothetical protein